MSDKGGKHRPSPPDHNVDLLELVALLALLKRPARPEVKQED